MGTITAMLTMSIEPQLRLMWLASPALPIGGFAYSEGLEAAVEQGLVHDGDSAAGWLSQQLHFVARGDLAAIAALIPAWQSGDTAELARVATWLRITRDSAEARLQSEQMGQSLLLWLRQQDAGLAARVERLPVSHALVMSLALSAVDLPLRQVLQSQAFGWAENQVQAALKAVPLGQNAGQCVLARLAAEIPAAVEVAISTEHRQVFVPRLAILAARHETQYSRLFRS